MLLDGAVRNAVVRGIPGPERLTRRAEELSLAEDPASDVGRGCQSSAADQKRKPEFLGE
jgi:hypothetical protein